MGLGEDAVKKAEADFKMLGEALEVLGDPTMRSLYDQGYDKVCQC
jgi:curved DNA-binding protein CbpA